MIDFLKKHVGKILAFVLFAILLGGSLSSYCEHDYYQVENAPAQLVIVRETFIPRFTFVLSSWPLAIASHIKYGRPSFKIVDANLDSVISAFATSEFLVIGAHGKKGRIYLDDKSWVAPALVPENGNLKHIYFGSCEFGNKRTQWQARYPNAEVHGYDGLTTPIHGWFYLAFYAPYALLSGGEV